MGIFNLRKQPDAMACIQFLNFEASLLLSTGCPEVSVPTLIEECAFIPQPTTKSFEPHMEEGMGIFLVYDMPLKSQIYSGSD